MLGGNSKIRLHDQIVFSPTGEGTGGGDKVDDVVEFGKSTVSSLVQGERGKALEDTENTERIQKIQGAVLEYYNLKKEDLLGPRRFRSIARPRQVAMYLCKEIPDCSFPEIGKNIGNRDHTTIMHGVRKIEELLKSDPDLVADIHSLRLTLDMPKSEEPSEKANQTSSVPSIESREAEPISGASIALIQLTVGQYYNIQKDDLLGKRKMRSLVRPRQLAMYLCSKIVTSNISKIGRKFNRDHSTVSSAIKKIEELLGTNEKIKRDFEEIKKLIKSSLSP